MGIPVPIVTVLMPVYNNASYLREAINSILGQTLRNLEFLIIDDGSSDESPQIVESYSDARIRLVRNESNLGLIESLNRGFDLARGKYIARMDGDDISSPERLATQVSFMKSNPSVGVCGTWAVMAGRSTRRLLRHPRTHDDIRLKLLFESALAHPSVVIDRGQFDRAGLRYDPKFPHVEDYELWVRCSDSTKLANIDRVLLTCRMHGNSVSALYKAEQDAMASQIRARQLERLGAEASEAERRLHDSIGRREFHGDVEYLEASESWLHKLKQVNRRRCYYPEPAFSYAMADRWFAICASAAGEGSRIYRKCFSSSLAKDSQMLSRKKFKVLWQCAKKALK